MANQPMISVIIPVYNGERFLADALRTVLAQAYHPLEIIIIDDGSTDSSAKLAAASGAPLRYVYQPNAGPAAARNTGLQLAEGELIAFLDVDDLWPVGKLHWQAHALKAAPALQLIWGYTQTVRLPSHPANDATQQPMPAAAIAPTLLPLVGSTLFRKELIAQAGVFNPQLRMSEDVDWLMRIREARIPIQVVNEVALIYQLHETNMTHGKKLVELKTIHAFKQSLDRRRQQNGGVVAALPPLNVKQRHEPSFGHQTGD